MGNLSEVRELNTGSKIALIGLGTGAPAYQYEEIKAAVSAALKVGYRHFDTASYYGSECALGAALSEAFQNGLVKREEVFITTKLWDDEHDEPLAAITRSLKNLQLEYVDLYLIHWPLRLRKGYVLPPREEDFLPVDIKSTWQGMEECFELGLTKAIGLSNFSCKKIEDILSYAKIPPAAIQVMLLYGHIEIEVLLLSMFRIDQNINCGFQVELHPMWQQKKLRDYCTKMKIQVCAWSPLGAPNTPWGSNVVMDNPVIKEIAKKHGKTVAQVVLRWGIEQGVCVLPKSFNKGRIAENFQIFEWRLTEEDHDKINKLEQRKILRGDDLVNSTTSPYRTIEELWDGEI